MLPLDPAPVQEDLVEAIANYACGIDARQARTLVDVRRDSRRDVGNGTSKYDYGSKLIRLSLTGDGQRYYSYDGLGSATALTDETGFPKVNLHLDAWGGPVAFGIVGGVRGVAEQPAGQRLTGVITEGRAFGTALVEEIGTAARQIFDFAKRVELADPGKIGAVPGQFRFKVKPVDAPLKPKELTTYENFDERSVKGDRLEGHEVLQNVLLEDAGLSKGRLSTEASRQNPVIALERDVHIEVGKAQRALGTAEMTVRNSIKANVEILRSVAKVSKQTAGAAYDWAHAREIGLLDDSKKK